MRTKTELKAPSTHPLASTYSPWTVQENVQWLLWSVHNIPSAAIYLLSLSQNGFSPSGCHTSQSDHTWAFHRLLFLKNCSNVGPYYGAHPSETGCSSTGHHRWQLLQPSCHGLLFMVCYSTCIYYKFIIVGIQVSLFLFFHYARANRLRDHRENIFFSDCPGTVILPNVWYDDILTLGDKQCYYWRFSCCSAVVYKAKDVQTSCSVLPVGGLVQTPCWTAGLLWFNPSTS